MTQSASSSPRTDRASRTYADFHVAIEPTPAGLEARVLISSEGQARAPFVAPFTPEEEAELDALLERGRGEGLSPADTDTLKALGGKLFDAVFPGAVGQKLAAAQASAKARGAALRIRLRLGAVAELDALPWEYLYQKSGNRFLAMFEDTAIVRYLEAGAVEPLSVAPPLRILVVTASPTDLAKLDEDAEIAKLEDALRDLSARGEVVLRRIQHATPGRLLTELDAEPVHVLHFIGHGGFVGGQGALAFEGEEGTAKLVNTDQLAASLGSHPSLRLAVLNACEGARGARNDPFRGVAQGLIQQGLGAVVAMQFPITDSAAKRFGAELYQAIAAGHPIDAAVARSRRALFVEGVGVEWGTPILHMRATDGRLFALPAEQALAVALPPQPAVVPAAATVNGGPTNAPPGTNSSSQPPGQDALFHGWSTSQRVFLSVFVTLLLALMVVFGGPYFAHAGALQKAVFALLATFLLSGFLGASGLIKNKTWFVGGSAAVFVVILAALLRVDDSPSLQWTQQGNVKGLPVGKTATVVVGECRATTTADTGHFTIDSREVCRQEKSSTTEVPGYVPFTGPPLPSSAASVFEFEWDAGVRKDVVEVWVECGHVASDASVAVGNCGVHVPVEMVDFGHFRFSPPPECADYKLEVRASNRVFLVAAKDMPSDGQLDLKPRAPELCQSSSSSSSSSSTSSSSSSSSSSSTSSSSGCTKALCEQVGSQLGLRLGHDDESIAVRLSDGVPTTGNTAASDALARKRFGNKGSCTCSVTWRGSGK